jgi:hypothetical protein
MMLLQELPIQAVAVAAWEISTQVLTLQKQVALV